MNYTYDEAVLKRLQATELDMLKTFDRICTKYDIPYFGMFGTAIGAVRHQGFIPWDDDIDIGLMRDDYERLLKVPKEEWGDLFLVDPEDDYGLHRAIIPRIYKKGTAFEAHYHINYSRNRDKCEDKYLPIRIDLMIHDRAPSRKVAEKNLRFACLMRHFYYWAKCDTHIMKTDPFEEKFKCFIKKLLHRLFNLTNRPEVKIRKAFLKKVSGKGGPFAVCYELAIKDIPKNIVFEYDKMMPTVKMPFEDMLISLNGNWDEMLRHSFGDYMQLPPEDQRVNHSPAVLDFGDGINVIENEVEKV